MPLVEISATPWGPAQTVEPIADGITFVSTSSHGGLYLSQERLDLVDAKFPEHRAQAFEHGRWFEEDCRAAYVVATFPEHFSTAALVDASQTLSWLGREYAAS